MRMILVFICSLALGLVNASGQETQPTKEKKKAAPTRQAQPGKPARKPAQAGRPTTAAPGKPVQAGKTKAAAKPTEAGKPSEYGKARGAAKATPAARPAETGKPRAAAKATPTGKAATAGKPGASPPPAAGGKPGKPGAAGVAAGKPFKPQHFNVASKGKPNPAKAPAVKFQQNERIQGSQNWQGANYQVFRNYKSEWHDKGWWRSHYPRVVFVFGGWYYWNAGYWFPAWGYAPNAYYFYNGPIYGYHGMPPDQVIANVQAALQQQGYYQGDVDGLLGPLTRDAIANYQRDHGLYVTSAIDQPTLQSLGMA